MRLKDKVAIVTGGAGAFGRQISLTYAREGATVVVADMNEEKAQAVVEEIKICGNQAIAVKLDITDEKDVASVINRLITRFKKIDILVNNAGISDSIPIQDATLPIWEKTLTVNLTGVFLMCREIINHMIENEYGKIVNIASISGLTGRPVSVHYAASKAGVIALTRTLANQVAEYGVNVNAVAPATVVTPILEKGFDQETIDRLKSTIPYKRQGKPEDIANLCLFLGSDESEWITGEVVVVSGGAFMG